MLCAIAHGEGQLCRTATLYLKFCIDWFSGLTEYISRFQPKFIMEINKFNTRDADPNYTLAILSRSVLLFSDAIRKLNECYWM